MLPPGRHRLPFVTQGSAPTAIIYQQCPAGRLKETRPEGTGIAGFLVLLPKPNKFRFLPSMAKQHRDPVRPEIATCLRQHSPGPNQPRGRGRTSNAAGQRGKISAINLQPAKSEGSEDACRETTMIFAGAAGELVPLSIPAHTAGVINFP